MLEALNAIVHPAVLAHGEAWMLAHTGHPYIIKEAAILFESGTWQQLDFVIGVYAPLELRILRTMLRDGASRQSVLQRVGQQMDEEEKMGKCRYVITNDGTKAIIPQVLELHQQILHYLHSGL
jgi:dephospho-CoA kinase